MPNFNQFQKPENEMNEMYSSWRNRTKTWNISFISVSVLVSIFLSFNPIFTYPYIPKYLCPWINLLLLWCVWQIRWCSVRIQLPKSERAIVFMVFLASPIFCRNLFCKKASLLIWDLAVQAQVRTSFHGLVCTREVRRGLIASLLSLKINLSCNTLSNAWAKSRKSNRLVFE